MCSFICGKEKGWFNMKGGMASPVWFFFFPWGALNAKCYFRCMIRNTNCNWHCFVILISNISHTWISPAFASEIFFWLDKQKMTNSEISFFPNEFRETHEETLTLKVHFSLKWRGLEFWPYKGKSRCFSRAISGFCKGYTHGKHLRIIWYVMCYQSLTW